MKFSPTSFTEFEDLVPLEKREYNPLNSQINATWSFYRKVGEDLKFISKVSFKLHIYSLSELSYLLKKAGWETIAAYGSFSALQPFSPITGLNLVAKAI